MGGKQFEGFATVEGIGPIGIFTLRGDQSSAEMAAAVKAAVGLPVPGKRQTERSGEMGASWMSPDELLLSLPYDAVGAALQAVNAALASTHFLAVDVSDAHAVFRVRGTKAREVLAKLAPVDLSPAAFQPGEIRRTRAAQVAAAFWISAPADTAGVEEFTLVCFRSVAAYVWELLTTEAEAAGEVGIY